MTKMIKLSKITSDRERNRYNDNEEDGEYVVPALTTPCMVNVAAVRCYYPRRDDRPGTRITFVDGGGFAVSQSFDAVTALIEAAE